MPKKKKAEHVEAMMKEAREKEIQARTAMFKVYLKDGMTPTEAGKAVDDWLEKLDDKE